MKDHDLEIILAEAEKEMKNQASLYDLSQETLDSIKHELDKVIDANYTRRSGKDTKNISRVYEGQRNERVVHKVR
jgi:hypothetical protein